MEVVQKLKHRAVVLLSREPESRRVNNDRAHTAMKTYATFRDSP